MPWNQTWVAWNPTFKPAKAKQGVLLESDEGSWKGHHIHLSWNKLKSETVAFSQLVPRHVVLHSPWSTKYFIAYHLFLIFIFLTTLKML